MSVFKLNGNGGGGQKTGVDGLFINKCKVMSVVDKSGLPINFGGKEWCPDCSIEITMNTGKDLLFTKTVNISGDFKYENNLPIGLGSAFKVLSAFDAMGIKDVELTEEGKIPIEWLKAVENKNVFVVDYVSGWNLDKNKAKYKAWDILFSEDTPTENIVKSFTDQVAKGFMKKYTPGVLVRKPQAPDVFSSEPEDDDLPF
jgi:hypothetical protein